MERPVSINSKQLQAFFYSQALADGFRTTVAILAPALLGSYFGFFELGVAAALGAMCVALSDSPGPPLNRRNSMLICTGLAVVVSLLTAFARRHPVLLGVEIAAVTFFFSLFVAYGARATAVGNAAILVMILTMDRPIENGQVLPHAAAVLAGGLFYLSLSLLLYRLRPYRPAQRVLGDCIRAVAAYLAIKADFYDVNTDLEKNYTRLVAQQVTVNEKQDLVRETFFKTRQIVRESTLESRRLVFTFVETVDLFEDITAAYYDYKSLRTLFGHTGALAVIHNSLRRIVAELEAVALAIQSNTAFRRGFDYNEEIKAVKRDIDAVSTPDKVVLRKLVVNLRNLLLDLESIEEYFGDNFSRKRTGVDHSHFVDHQPLDPKILANNLNLKSAAFRHAIRVCLACLVGYAFTKVFPYGQHSYWILLTIAFISKPAFSLTKQRNIERIIGTVVGSGIGIGLLLLVQDRNWLFAMMVLLMIGTYSFLRLNYLAMVLFLTPYVLILFSFLGTGFELVVKERIIDTLIGCGIAFTASYLLFPSWEAEQLKTHMQGIVKANAGYLETIIRALAGERIGTVEYKLARKEVYLNSANLSAAFQRMLSEPRNKQGPRSAVQQFVVLNHILFSNIATLATTLLGREPRPYAAELLQVAKKAHGRLQDCLKKLGAEVEPTPPLETPLAIGGELSADDLLMKEQLAFVYGVSKDIERTAVLLKKV